MTFEEIGKEMNLTKRQVQIACRNGLEKMLNIIKNDPDKLNYFLDSLVADDYKHLPPRDFNL